MVTLLGSFGANRRAAAAQQWAALRTAAAQQAHRGVRIALIHSIYQRASAGDKAWIIWQETGVRQDTWFHGGVPCSTGTFVLLGGSVGYGPHNNNPRVLYVNPADVLGTASAKSLKAWRKQNRQGG
ncbi:hypothetical protein [Streptomyces sp. I8-5]|uniref:hypothetical protein n=1 Tax=Streptomyces sp. I8-5 TaxID=3104277 RepID=UPI00386D8578